MVIFTLKTDTMTPTTHITIYIIIIDIMGNKVSIVQLNKLSVKFFLIIITF